MDSYGDNITIGCLRKIAFYRLLIFFSWCVCVSERRWKVCSSLDVYEYLSMNESIECVCVQI